MDAIIFWFFAIVGALVMIPVFLTLAVCFVGSLLLRCARMYAGLRAALLSAATVTRNIGRRVRAR
jgi:hypothetical protein